MSKTCGLTVAMVVCGITVFSTASYAGPEYYSMSGNQCRVSGSIAEAGKVSYTDGVITNISTTSANVTCPISWSGDDSDVLVTTAYVRVVYCDGDNSFSVGDLSCQWIIQDSLLNKYSNATTGTRHSCTAFPNDGCQAADPSYVTPAGNGSSMRVFSPATGVPQISNMYVQCTLPRASTIIGYWLFTPTHNGV